MHSYWVLKAQKSIYHLKVAIFDEKMAVGKSENLVTLHLYDLMQPSDKEILGDPLILRTLDVPNSLWTKL